ncbi:hypothetical protein BXO87_14955 [Bacillus sp. GZB]|nr:hypothetical protein B9C53_19290 [Bacillus velezensis]OMQ04017.1 hypothetical protein BXO87_14955 [Bacillus sp. GZB]
MEGKRTENGDPPSVNKHRFSKFRKQQKAPSANLPRGLDTTGFMIDFIVSRLVKKQAKNVLF